MRMLAAACPNKRHPVCNLVADYNGIHVSSLPPPASHFMRSRCKAPVVVCLGSNF